MKFKFLHTADIHLDSPLRGLEAYEGAPVDKIRGATRKAFENLVEIAIEEKVQFIIIAGDVYDGDWKDFNTGLFFVHQMTKLKEKNIKVYIIKGNHDAANKMTKEIKFPNNVYEFSYKNPETIYDEYLKVALHGQSFKTRDVKENLSNNYQNRIKDYFNIGILHTGLTGREGHENYSPCKTEDLISKNYDYWALGHIHKREIICEDPYIIFPGNIQGRHIRETGEKSCTIIEVNNNEIIEIYELGTDVLRWFILDIKLDDLETYEELLNKIKIDMNDLLDRNNEKFLAIRVNLEGSCQFNSFLKNNLEKIETDIRALSIEVGIDVVWIEKIKINSFEKLSIEDLLEKNPFLSEFIEYFDNIDDENIKGIINEFNSLKKTLPNEYFEEFDILNFENEKKLFEDSKDIIISSILEREGRDNEDKKS